MVVPGQSRGLRDALVFFRAFQDGAACATSSGQECWPCTQCSRSASTEDVEDHAVMIRGAGRDPRRAKCGLVRRVRKLLWLQGDTVAHAVEMAVFTDECPVEE